MTPEDLRRAKILSTLLNQAHAAKARASNPHAFIKLMIAYHRAARLADGLEPIVLARIIDYRLGHVYARMSLFRDSDANAIYDAVREVWERSASGASRIPTDLDLTPQGLVTRALHHFGCAAAEPSPVHLQFWSHLYRVAMLRRLEAPGFFGHDYGRAYVEQAWNDALTAFLDHGYQNRLHSAAHCKHLGQPDLALYTPLDLLRYVLDLDGDRVDRRMTQLAFRDPLFVSRPQRAEWRLLSFPAWQRPVTRAGGTRAFEVAFNDYMAASSFLDDLRRAEPGALFFELHPEGASHTLEGAHRLPHRRDGETFTDTLEPWGGGIGDKEARYLAALLEVQHLTDVEARKQHVYERVWPQWANQTRSARQNNNARHNMESRLRDIVGPLPKVFAAELARERREAEGVGAQVGDNPAQEQAQRRVWAAERPGMSDHEMREAAEKASSFLPTTGRPEDACLILEGVRIYGIVHWPTYLRQQGLEPLAEDDESEARSD